MKCPKCGMEISESAKFCEHCGNVIRQSKIDSSASDTVSQRTTPVPPNQNNTTPVPKKKKGMTWWQLSILVVSIVLVGLLVCVFLFSGFMSCVASRSEQNSQSTIASSDAANQGDEGQTSETSSYIPVGTAATNNNLSIAVTGVTEQKAVDASFGQYSAEEGSKYIVVNVTVKNVGDSMESFQASDFQIKTKDDVQYSPSLLPVADEFMSYESLNPGLEQSYSIAFETPDTVVLSDCYMQVQQFLSLQQSRFALS
ncbi:DUF4352 domain-containing protein [Massilioclostridium coli]|uniref:DUF4352 domain-containing protein n=1 Tax=Massilioclostridium coli TaxID=1870991 RepID=UPI0022E17AC7|nr:DUF4352 domain-containing protein [Massilioclostridium coli]